MVRQYFKLFLVSCYEGSLTRYLKMKQIQKFNYKFSIVTFDGKYVTKIGKRIGILKESLQKLRKVLRYSNHSLKRKYN